jgi:hypothetical protein
MNEPKTFAEALAAHNAQVDALAARREADRAEREAERQARADALPELDWLWAHTLADLPGWYTPPELRPPPREPKPKAQPRRRRKRLPAGWLAPVVPIR